MIPVTLTLRNFMSYGEESTTLDLTGLHVLCLSGDNGNGKSALLDAITYALWGKTRASGSQASSEDDLVRVGADDMEVSLVFRLGEDLYRAIRKRSRQTRTGEWQVHLRDDGGTWRPVGGSGMKETERHLLRILRMEYETFLNSAYLQQGHADEFTRQKPDARKRILADILDLRRYDRLEEMAKERKSECDLALKDLDGEIRHLEARADDEATYRQKRMEHEAALANWTRERTVREETYKRLQAQCAALDKKAQHLRGREERLHEFEHDNKELESEIAQLNVEIAQNEALIADRAVIEADLNRLNWMRERMRALESDLRALHAAEQEAIQVEGRLALLEQELKSQVVAAEGECRRLEERERRVADLKAQLEDLESRRAPFMNAETELERAQADSLRVQEAFANLSAHHGRLKREIADMEEILALLSETTSTCPVCRSEFAQGRRAVVLQEQQQKKEDLQEQLADVNRQGNALKKERDTLQSRTALLQEQARSEAALRARQKTLAESLREVEAPADEAEEIRTRAETLRRRLAEKAFGAEERKQQERARQQIAQLQVSARQHDEAQAIVRELSERQVERRAAQLEEAVNADERNRARRDVLVQKHHKRCEQIAAERARQEAMRAELADYAALRRQVCQEEQTLREAVEAADRARSQVERADQALEDCARASTQVAGKAERERLARDKQAYQELVAAFGKRGVQALIIENVLPEIETEANHLLARLTDNTMQVTLSTLRTARSGGQQIETLDIQLTDDVGTRPYEMFSGGEGFRVNFALRIALSRLLARRAGARLQTLIIDEGFGTQDAKGRGRLVEAIEAVKDEFALILVISHIEELKDAFPARVEVIKTPSGSQIHLLE